MKVLGVLEHGDNRGYPFANCFDEIHLIKSVEDFTARKVDAIVFWGGTDISPTFYGEKPNTFNEAKVIPSRRDLLEWTLMKYCVGSKIPMIGVCRGAQMLCVFAGGKLAQDVSGHGRAHLITTYDNESFVPQANHHQLMIPGKVEHDLLAWASQGIVAEYYTGEDDVISYFDKGFKHPEIVWFPAIQGLAIQPHPEWMGECAFNDYIRELTRNYCLGVH
jgi:hypothetical protein